MESLLAFFNYKVALLLSAFHQVPPLGVTLMLFRLKVFEALHTTAIWGMRICVVSTFTSRIKAIAQPSTEVNLPVMVDLGASKNKDSFLEVPKSVVLVPVVIDQSPDHACPVTVLLPDNSTVCAPHKVSSVGR